MNILYLAHRIPYPPNKGDKIRSFNQIRMLSKYHTIHLACLVDAKGDLQYLDALKKYCASIDVVYRNPFSMCLRALMAVATRRPLSVGSFYSRELQRKIDKRLNEESIDRIFIFSSAMAEYVQKASAIPQCVDFVDVDSAKWDLYATLQSFPLSWVYRLEGKRLGRYEATVARNCEHAIVVSQAEADLFQKHASIQTLSVIPNGVDLEYFVRPSDCPPSAELNIVFTGMMDYFPNVDAVSHFCNSILPRVLRWSPAAKFIIAGRNPTAKVRALASHPNVTVTGEVPDIRPYLTQAAVAVAPFRIARGIQNKVLEAMAMGVPIVATPIALQGMVMDSRGGVLSADTPESFADAIVSLLRDPKLRSQLGDQARAYVMQAYRWEAHEALLMELLA